jgi:hypothetical protein
MTNQNKAKKYEKLVKELASTIFSKAQIKGEHCFFVPDPLRYRLIMKILLKLPIGPYKKTLERVVLHRMIFYTWAVSSELNKIMTEAESSNSIHSLSMKEFVQKCKSWAESKISEIHSFAEDVEEHMILTGNLAPLSYSFVDQNLYVALTLLPKYDKSDKEDVKEKLMEIIDNYLKNQDIIVDPANIFWAILAKAKRGEKVDGHVRKVLEKRIGQGQVYYFSPNENMLGRLLEQGDVTPEIYNSQRSTLFFLVDAQELLNLNVLENNTANELKETIKKAEAWVESNVKKDNIFFSSIYLHYILITPTGQENKKLYERRIEEAYIKEVEKRRIKLGILVIFISLVFLFLLYLFSALFYFPLSNSAILSTILTPIFLKLVEKLIDLLLDVISRRGV